MNRRRLIHGLLALPASRLIATRPLIVGPARRPPVSLNARAPTIRLAPSGPVTSTADGQIIEDLDISSNAGNGITVMHHSVTVRNCRIRHAGGHGLRAEGVAGLRLHDLEIDHTGAPPAGVGPSEDCNNVDLEGCPEQSLPE